MGVGSSSPLNKEKYLFVCTWKLGHEKTPKPLWYRGFPVQYLFWLHNMVAGEGLEPTTFGLWELNWGFSTFLNFLIFALNKAYFKGFLECHFWTLPGFFRHFWENNGNFPFVLLLKFFIYVSLSDFALQLMSPKNNWKRDYGLPSGGGGRTFSFCIQQIDLPHLSESLGRKIV